MRLTFAQIQAIRQTIRRMLVVVFFEGEGRANSASLPCWAKACRKWNISRAPSANERCLPCSCLPVWVERSAFARRFPAAVLKCRPTR